MESGHPSRTGQASPWGQALSELEWFLLRDRQWKGQDSALGWEASPYREACVEVGRERGGISQGRLPGRGREV